MATSETPSRSDANEHSSDAVAAVVAASGRAAIRSRLPCQRMSRSVPLMRAARAIFFPTADDDQRASAQQNA
jgi:hypothetical protein